jgi:hypothetical protein
MHAGIGRKTIFRLPHSIRFGVYPCREQMSRWNAETERRLDFRIGIRRDVADAVRNISLRNYIPAGETDEMTFVISRDYA